MLRPCSEWWWHDESRSGRLGRPRSILRGTIGAVDRQLNADGRLILIENVADVAYKIVIQPRQQTSRTDARSRPALTDILNHIDTIFAHDCHG